MSRIGVVIVNYNGLKFQNAAIRSIKEQTYTDYEIIVVDNASTDASVEELLKEFPDVTLIHAGDNVGVAAGNNIGIQYAISHGMEYVMLLNNDVVLDEKLFELLMEKATKNIITVPKIYYYDRKKLIWSAGGFVDWSSGIPGHLGYKCNDCATLSKEKYVEIAPTCCMLIHRNVFQEVGKMDEKYFMYYDDTDFCIRANHKGFKILYVPTAVMWHKVSSSSGGEQSKVYQYYCNRNMLYFMDKYKSKIKKNKWYYIKNQIQYFINHYKDNKNLVYGLLGFFDYFRGKMYRRDFS